VIERAAARHADDVDAQFLALMCADEDLLRAEFDAIIAAGWCRQSGEPVVPVPTPMSKQRGVARSTGRPDPVSRRRGITDGSLARERSPPPM
jgi:hypothetical protein